MHRLALALGWLDVDAMEASMSNSAYHRWIAFFAAEPWGAEVEWLRTGVVASMVANASPNRRAGSKPLTPADFVPKPKTDPVKRVSDGLDPKRIRRELFGAFGDRIKRKE